MGLFSKDRETGIMVEYANTQCVDYQSKRAGVTFPLPVGVKMSEAMALARFLVHFEIDNGKYDRAERKALEFVYKEVFGEPLIDYIERMKPRKIVKSKSEYENESDEETY